MELEFPIEAIVPGIPVSLQASGKSKERWKEHVRDNLRPLLPDNHFCTEEPVGVQILVFPRSQMEGDVDNIVKPILDALNQFVYLDDRQVEKLSVQKIEPSQLSRIVNPTGLLVSVMQNTEPCVYIRLHQEFEVVM